MSKAEVLHRIHQTGLVPVLRADSTDDALAIAAAIFEGGIDVMEVTMTVPGAMRVIKTLVREYPEMLIGAGTVLDPETARACMLEGAQFIVSPAANVNLIEMCHRYSCAVLPGALTPTEILNAWQSGADIVKVFPVSAMGGSEYFRRLSGPLPQIQLLASGGVTLETVNDFLNAGAFAIGVGSELANINLIRSSKQETISLLARDWLRAISDFRSSSTTPAAPAKG